MQGHGSAKHIADPPHRAFTENRLQSAAVPLQRAAPPCYASSHTPKSDLSGARPVTARATNAPSPIATRRAFLGAGAVGAAAWLAFGSGAEAATEGFAAEFKRVVAGRKLLEGKIKIDLPTIAENGLVVPMNFEVESPMTETDFVKAVHFFAEDNPNPQVASFYFTPLSPKAAASVRIRLARTQNVVAVAEMANGDLYTAKREVKVTIGGCGG
jgi:sulfur-oxidizing protein SoxY